MADRDDEHLDLLAVLHYIVAAMAGMFSLFPVIHLVIGILVIRGGFGEPRGEEIPAAFGWFFVGMASVAILAGLTFSTLLFVAGRSLRARRRHTFCVVMAALSCCFAPFGTALGVFTLVVLLRDGVKARFQAAPAPG